MSSIKEIAAEADEAIAEAQAEIDKGDKDEARLTLTVACDCVNEWMGDHINDKRYNALLAIWDKLDRARKPLLGPGETR